MTKSLPNLYKQYTWYAHTDEKRVINSDEIVQERLAKMRQMQGKEQTFSGNIFTAGNIAQGAEVLEVVNPVEEAQKEAEKILEDAKKEAEVLIADAQANVRAIQNEASEQGYREGRQQLEDEFAVKRRELEDDFMTRQEVLENEYEMKRQDMEKNLVDVILDVFNKVFHIQFDKKKHILMYLIEDAILNIEGDKKFRIKTADNNVLFLENHREEILERVGHGIEIEIVADSSMDGNDCLIETDSGVFDCSLGVQLENLIKDLKSLCS